MKAMLSVGGCKEESRACSNGKLQSNREDGGRRMIDSGLGDKLRSFVSSIHPSLSTSTTRSETGSHQFGETLYERNARTNQINNSLSKICFKLCRSS